MGIDDTGVPPTYESSGRLVTACPDFLAGQRAVEGITADGIDQGADRCLARRDDPPPLRVRPAAQPGQGHLRQVTGPVADLPESPVAETRRRLRHAWRYHGGITWPDPGLATQMAAACAGSLSRHDLDLGCRSDDLRRKDLARKSGVCRDVSAGKLNEPLHGADLQNSLNSPGSTVYGNPPGA